MAYTPTDWKDHVVQRPKTFEVPRRCHSAGYAYVGHQFQQCRAGHLDRAFDA